MDWGDLVTKTAAALGAVLGIFNTLQGWRQRKVYLRVIPTTLEVQNHIGQDGGGGVVYQRFVSPAVEIRNLSSFPVTLEEVGYEIKGSGPHPLTRLDRPGSWTSSGQIWIAEKMPQRLESRASLRVALYNKDEDALKGKRIRAAYARTACGTTARGINRALRTMTDRLSRGESGIEPVLQKK